jgi:hypothetical protein
MADGMVGPGSTAQGRERAPVVSGDVVPFAPGFVIDDAFALHFASIPHQMACRLSHLILQPYTQLYHFAMAPPRKCIYAVLYAKPDKLDATMDRAFAAKMSTARGRSGN